MKCRITSDWCFRNLANAITLLGVSLSLILSWVVFFHREWTIAIFILVSGVLMTDFLDGKVARYFNSISKLGSAMDRLRDKIFQLTMFSFCLLEPRVIIWLKGPVCFLLIAAEILLLTIWYLGVRRGLDVSAGIWGKAKMFLVLTGILVCPAIIIAKERGMSVPFFVTHLLSLIFVVSFGLAVMSFKKHISQYCEQVAVS